MMNYFCVYFASSTFLHKGSDALKRARVPHRIVRLSEELDLRGCTRCIMVSSVYKERAVSMLMEEGVKYLSVKEVETL